MGESDLNKIGHTTVNYERIEKIRAILAEREK